jgi:hypothetical protein
MSYTPDEARALGQAIADDPESLTMIQVSLQVRGFRDRFGYGTQTPVIRASGLDRGFYSRVEKGAKRFGKRSLTAYIIGTYELVMATQPHRRLEYLAWLMDELLPAVYQDNQVAYEKREQIIDQRRTAKEERGEA